MQGGHFDLGLGLRLHQDYLSSSISSCIPCFHDRYGSASRDLRIVTSRYLHLQQMEHRATESSSECMVLMICIRLQTCFPVTTGPLFFISDVPHLIKTVRNCWANSFGHKHTRKLQVCLQVILCLCSCTISPNVPYYFTDVCTIIIRLMVSTFHGPTWNSCTRYIVGMVRLQHQV